MRMQTISALGVLALVLGIASTAEASSFVDITYDISDTIVVNTLAPTCPDNVSACLVTNTLGGTMKIRYASNSASSMPILHGPATLQSLALNAKITIAAFVGGTYYNPPLSTAYVNFKLVSSVGGNLLSGGTLTFGSAQVRATGRRHCQYLTAFPGFCIALLGQLTSVPGPLEPYTTTGTFSFAASAGPYGGAQSTRHTVSGTVPAYAPSKILAIDARMYFATALSLVGREVLREAPGHDPKVTPEPGTLLLLGAGAAGLVLVSRVRHRSRQD